MLPSLAYLQYVSLPILFRIVPFHLIHSKNGTGHVIYFDLVMIAEASLHHQEDRDEVFNPGNNYGVNPFNKAQPWRKNKRKSPDSLPSLHERKIKYDLKKLI